MKPESEKSSLWVQCMCTTLVALGAAYASYRHGRDFALRFGADAATAAIWPLIVDGLLTTATVELWKQSDGRRWAAWTAFGFGISLSLCANIGSAPRLTVFSIVLAACPPLALLLAVELLNRALKRNRGDDRGRSSESLDASSEPAVEAAEVACSSASGAEFSLPAEASAEQQMWAFYLEEQAAGRTPTGADLDRVAGTNNYGRRVLRRWRTNGRGPAGAMAPDSAALGPPPRVSPVGEWNADGLESTLNRS
ncbi:DUF2637 domain-containing protein [Amycolatopsis sp. A133]|uniref:DUF2637 domain-containing protein n=1 Tax=Amycolatopsis sp. A133 TaxID=3064472 RepID=UPI0027EB4739|nr:DUF2637 domain-containing protein [Amycolatopsis sp. A133]MDQ7809380.1 DUF2637 domain-containing protein [Amycolatopsis sp. A133]